MTRPGMFWEAFLKYESRQCPCIHKGPYVCFQLNFTIYLDDCWLVGPIFSGSPISESLNAHARTVGGDQEAMHFEGALRGENENGSRQNCHNIEIVNSHESEVLVMAVS